MINIIEGSYLLATVASLYINPVSCDGISQRGLARYFKQSMTKTVYHWEMACDFPMQRGYIYTFKDVVFFPVRERYKDTIADKALIETNLILLKDGFDTRFDGYIKNFKKGINMPALGYMRVTGHPLRIRETHFLLGVHISVIPEMLLTQGLQMPCSYGICNTSPSKMCKLSLKSMKGAR